MKWLISTLVILIVVTALLYSYICDRALMDPIILFATFVAILVYTMKTMELSDSTKEMAKQAERQVSIQAKVYEDSQTPVVAFNIDSKPDQGPDAWTRVTLSNFSNFDTSVWINLNLKVNGTPLNVRPPHYTGAEPWHLQAGDRIHAPGFPLTDVLNHVGQTLTQLNQQAISGNLQVSVTLEIEVNHTAYGGRIIEKPVRRYHFHFAKLVWVYDV